jgi:PelA/Pel-15E family pectate lyase
MKSIKSILIGVMLLSVLPTSAQQAFKQLMRETSQEFFQSDEARRIGDQLLLYQRVTGGWPKNIDMAKPLSDKEREKIVADKQKLNDSTTDNDATTLQLNFLARLYQSTKDVRYRDAFRQGVAYLLSGQYENGGWPQFWPVMRDYQIHITYNDDAMANTMILLRDIAAQKEPYQGDLTDDQLRQQMTKAFNKGIECILNTQIVTDGELTVWCQQHDRETLLPAHARAFELPSYCTMESATLTRLLMELPNPDERVKKAVHAAMRWFDKYKLTGYKVERTGRPGSADQNTKLVKDTLAPPIWARFYDLELCEPFVCDRDGVPRRHLEQIGAERRNGYAWYSDRPISLYKRYQKWAKKYDPTNKVDISLETKGANENGTIEWFRKPTKHTSDFDAVVKPGDNIQQAIEKAPAVPNKPYKILIRKGTYQQKVIIDRPNIVLVGEERDSTILTLAEASKKKLISKYHGKDVGNGVIVLQEGADDCIISGLTVYNNYGTTVEPGNTTHQMAIFGRGTRTIIINCNIWADGNDALALWAKGGGMYYHADLYLRSLGVDFLCPRGWCYATRCRFEGDGHAIIWHDGRGDKHQKLVIKDSWFDAKRPTPLGRYHHDSQFFLMNCRLSSQILDQNISYAYTDKVLDPCPWGQRAYYYNCHREGGDSGWLKNNIEKSEEKPDFHGVTALWTFNNKWDPENRIRDLWNVLAY